MGALEQAREVEGGKHRDSVHRGSWASTATPTNAVAVTESGLRPQTMAWPRVSGRSSILLEKPALPQHLYCCWTSSNNLGPVRQHSGNQWPLVTRRKHWGLVSQAPPTCHIPPPYWWSPDWGDLDTLGTPTTLVGTRQFPCLKHPHPPNSPSCPGPLLWLWRHKLHR